MTDQLDLDTIRADLGRVAEALGAGVLQFSDDTPLSLAATLALLLDDQVPALIVEVGRLRKLVPPLFWCEAGEMVLVKDPAAFFAQPRPVEPFNIDPAFLFNTVAPGQPETRITSITLNPTPQAVVAAGDEIKVSVDGSAYEYVGTVDKVIDDNTAEVTLTERRPRESQQDTP